MHDVEYEGHGQVVFTTHGMSAEEGFARWREMFAESTAPCILERTGAGDFFAHGRVRSIGKLTIFTSACRQGFGSRGIRSKSEIARSQDDGLMLFLRNGNAAASLKYGKQEAAKLGSGVWTVMHPQDVCESAAGPGMVEYHALTIPEEFCRGLGPISGDAFGRTMSPNDLVNRLVANYIQTLAAGGPIADAATGDAIARNLMELVAFALRGGAHAREACDNGVASGLLLAIMRYIDEHYAQPELSPAQVAARFGITPRYVHRLFQRTGTTFTEQLFQRRLRRAHLLLNDPLHRHRSITDIAYDCGFRNLAHFGRRYREMYGQSPREHRMRA